MKTTMKIHIHICTLKYRCEINIYPCKMGSISNVILMRETAQNECVSIKNGHQIHM